MENKKRKIHSSESELGKMPPQNKGFEDAVISALIIESFVLPQVTPFLKAECFYYEENQRIYGAILRLEKKREKIDLLSISKELTSAGELEIVGGNFALIKKMQIVSSSLNIERDAMMVYQYYCLRAMATLGNKLIAMCYESGADCFEILETINKDLKEIDFIGRSSIKVVGDVVYDILKEIKYASENGVKAGITTGHINTDKHFSKQKQDLGILASRPGMGKTAYMLSCAKHTAIELKKPVAIFSLEMSTAKLVGRLMASESLISSKTINEKTLLSSDLQALGNGVSRLLDAPIYIDDTGGLDITLLRSKIRKMKQMFNIEEVYIDYLQLMRGEKGSGNREQEISTISRNLKLIAKEEDIPITALSQLSRDVEKRADKRAMLSDLRESGAIEQDADWVMFIMRPEYYGLIDENSGLYLGESFQGRNLYGENLMMLDMAKYREGSLFVSALKFYGDTMRVTNYNLNGEVDDNGLEENNDFINS